MQLELTDNDYVACEQPRRAGVRTDVVRELAGRAGRLDVAQTVDGLHLLQHLAFLYRLRFVLLLEPDQRHTAETSPHSAKTSPHRVQSISQSVTLTLIIVRTRAAYTAHYHER